MVELFGPLHGIRVYWSDRELELMLMGQETELPRGVECKRYDWEAEDYEALEDAVGPGERLVVIHRWPVDHCGECKTPCGREEGVDDGDNLLEFPLPRDEED
jgi:hypothetical protein